MAQTSVTGIQDQSMTTNPFLLGGQISQAQPRATSVPTGIQAQPVSGSTALETELANIRALNQGQASGGLGKTIGGAAGTGIGAAIGGPGGAAVGGAAGQTVGSIVDYMIEKDARNEAQIIRENALRKEKNRNIKKASTNAWLENMAKMKGIAISEEQEKMDKNKVAKSMRENFMVELMNKIAQGAQKDEILKNKFLKSRSL